MVAPLGQLQLASPLQNPGLSGFQQGLQAAYSPMLMAMQPMMNMAKAQYYSGKGNLAQQSADLLNQGYAGQMGQALYSLKKADPTGTLAQMYLQGTLGKPLAQMNMYDTYSNLNQAKLPLIKQETAFLPTKYGYPPGIMGPSSGSTNSGSQQGTQQSTEQGSTQPSQSQQPQEITLDDFASGNMKLSNPQPGDAFMQNPQKLMQSLQSSTPFGNRLQNMWNNFNKKGTASLIGTSNKFGVIPTSLGGLKRDIAAIPANWGDGSDAYNNVNALAQQNKTVIENYTNQLMPGTRAWGAFKNNLGILDPTQVPNATIYKNNLLNMAVLHVQDLTDIANGSYPYNIRQNALNQLKSLSKLDVYKQAVAAYKNGQLPISPNGEEGNTGASQTKPTQTSSLVQGVPDDFSQQYAKQKGWL